MKKIILLLSFVFILQFSFAQLKFNFGPELGMAFSNIPKYNSYSLTIGNQDKVKEKTFPLISPLVGIHMQLIAKKNFLFTTGIQYEMAGQKYTLTDNALDAKNNNAPYTSEVISKQSFQKVCFLLSVGYTFTLFKLHFSVYGGWRPNYFFTGKYDSTLTINHSIKSLSYKYEQEYNPLVDCYSPVKNINNQYYYGISVSKKRFEFALNHCVGFKIYYYKYWFANSSIIYKNNDFTLTVRYRFYALKNNKVKCNLFSNSSSNEKVKGL